jgi:hypothetical protein
MSRCQEFFPILQNKNWSIIHPSFYIQHSCLVRPIDKRWIHLWPDIIRLVQGLERLGLEYHNGEVSYAGLEGVNV